MDSRRLIRAFVLLLALCAIARADELKLWYRQPAAKWEEALPIGSGRLGAMVFGGVDSERIQFNEDTLWTGKPHDYAQARHFVWRPDHVHLPHHKGDELRARAVPSGDAVRFLFIFS